MSTTTLVAKPRPGTTGAGLDRATVFLISIGRDEQGTPTGLHTFPGRASDTKIFYPRRGKPPWLKTPRQVLWVAGHLHPGETLLIEPKDEQGQEVFGWPAFEIRHPQIMVCSGEAKKHALLKWAYSITLKYGHPKKAIVLDPVIIIEQDPPGEEP
jgi:hypothetical protein